MFEGKITEIKGRQVWDSRGRPTIEAEVRVGGGAMGRAIAPAGASVGSGEAVDLRDGGDKFGGYGVHRALRSISEEIAPALQGLKVENQAAIDERMTELDGTADKSRLGGNAMIAVSMAVAHAAAAAAGKPLYQHLLRDKQAVMPMPEIQIFGGGAHAGRRVDIQDFMVVPLRAFSIASALEMVAEVYRAAGRLMADAGRLYGVADEGGYWPAFDSNEAVLDALVLAIEHAGFTPGDDVAISLDIAASEFGRAGRYELGLEERVLDSDGMVALVADWVQRYPIVSVEDPLAEDDFGGLAKLTAAVGDKVQVVADDAIVTDADRIRAAARQKACNTALLKPNQCGTLTATMAALATARWAGWDSILSARSGESEDVTIAHLAVGWGIRQIKVGSFARSERMAKWNELIRIEEALGGAAWFAGRAVFKGRS